MHTTRHDALFLECVLKYSTRIFINGFSIRHKAEIDLLVDNILANYNSSEEESMPRKNFTRGMTNLTKITADEEAGMAFTLLFLHKPTKVKEYLTVDSIINLTKTIMMTN